MPWCKQQVDENDADSGTTLDDDILSFHTM
jgi:hypothetical protein